MKTGLTIEFNNLKFLVTFFDGHEIRLKRTNTDNAKEISGDYRFEKIKLMGWNRFYPYKIT